MKYKSLNEYLETIPEQYRNNISILETFHGGNTKISVQNPCGHTTNHLLKEFLTRKSFDFCNSCYTINNYLKDIPLEYRNLIEFKTNNGYDSEIIFKNKCGHDSVTRVGAFVKRKQFDYCLKCETSNRTKTAQEYINSLSEEIRNRIISIGQDFGRLTKVTIQYPCGCIREIKLHALLQNGLLRCRCNPYNQLSKEDMIKQLDPYLDKVEIISNFPGNRTSELSGICKVCSKEFRSRFFNMQQYFRYHKTGCPNCNTTNEQQKEVIDFVSKLSDNVEIDNRTIVKFDSNKFKELDIYCPDQKLAIEYNGLVWHSERYKSDIQYHWKKTKSCKDQGIVLFHIWSDLYQRKKEIYQSILRLKFGKVLNRVYARKTTLVELTKEEIKNFFDKNHLDGSVNCITGWGLKIDDKLVEAISVRKVNNQNKKYKGYLEIARQATLVDYLVVGGESKLLTVVEEYAKNHEFKGILNYVSCDFGGIPKSKWKFTYQGITDISYFYTNGSNRISRQKLQKRKPGQTEKELAEENGLLKVGGTPNLVYTLKF